jgi:hypothetical protein
LYRRRSSITPIARREQAPRQELTLHSDMKTDEFKAILKRLEELYAAAGTAGPANDIRSVARLLDGSEGKTLDEFIAETRALLESPRSQPAATSADHELVAKYSARLLEAGTDQAAFDATLGALDVDHQLKPADWYAIANRYRNAPSGGTHTYKFKSVKAAREAIRDVFIERFEAESKRGVLDRIFGRSPLNT